MSTRLLIVDDDRRQGDALARLVSVQRRDLTVLTARNGADAIDVMESAAIDFVLTDLQMPELDGFGLLAWIASRQPHVSVIAMTAYPDVVSTSRLVELGGIECLTKPIDVSHVLARIDQAIGDQSRGHLRDIGLPSLLQVMEMEQKTAVLTVECGGRVGHLYLQTGELVNARFGTLRGDDAALEVLSWTGPSITIQGSATPMERSIEQPLGFLIMEAMRLQDERRAARSRGDDDRDDTSPSCEPEALPDGVFALDVRDLDSGDRVLCQGEWGPVAPMADFAARAWEPLVEEVILTSHEHWVIARPAGPDCIAVAGVGTQPAHLMAARRLLARAIAALNESRSA